MGQNKILNTHLITMSVVITMMFFLSFTFVFAQEDTDISISNTSAIDSTDTDKTVETVQVKPFVNTRIDVRDGIQEKRDGVRSSLQEKRDGLREDIQNRSLDARESLSDKKTDLAERRAETEEKLAERKTERAGKLAEKAKDRINAYVKRITKRLVAALDRIEKMIDRVDSRITKLEEKFDDRGLDLSESKRLLGEARSEVASALEDISSIESTITEVINTDNPRESFSAVRELIKSAVASVKNAHRALVEAVKEVKASVGSEIQPSNDKGETEVE